MQIVLMHRNTLTEVSITTDGDDIETLYIPEIVGAMSSEVRRVLEQDGIGMFGHDLDLEEGDTNYNLRHAVENCEGLVNYEIIQVDPFEYITPIAITEGVTD